MKNEYPTIFSRYFASLLDMSVAFVIAVIIGKYLLPPEIENDTLILIFTLPFLIYEPIFTSYLATLGQIIFRFRVRQISSHEKIPLWRAYIRYLVKIYLGLISILTIPARKDRRAIHDLAAKSIALNL